MSVVSPELSEAWTLRRRSGTQFPANIERGEPAMEHSAGLPGYASDDTPVRYMPIPWNDAQRAPATATADRSARRGTGGVAIPGSQSGSTALLTARELEVIELVATGATDQQIADALFIARRTVTSHMASILFKLKVGNRTAAAVSAARSGLIW